MLTDVRDKIRDASRKEGKLWEEVKEHKRRVEEHSKIGVCQELYHRELCDQAASIDRRMDAVRAEIGGHLQTLVDNGMTNLGVVQRHYKSYTGNEIPSR